MLRLAAFVLLLAAWIAVGLDWLPDIVVVLLFFLSIGLAFSLFLRHGGDLIQGWSRSQHDPDRRRR